MGGALHAPIPIMLCAPDGFRFAQPILQWLILGLLPNKKLLAQPEVPDNRNSSDGN